MSIREKVLFPAFTDKDFKEFMTEATHSVYECHVINKHTQRGENVSIIKLAAKDSREIPFFVMTYNTEIYKSKSFGRISHQDITGIYLVDDNAIIFESEYRAQDFRPLISDISIYIASQIDEEMQAHLLTHLREAVLLQKELGAKPDKGYESTNSITNWYVNGLQPINFIGRNTDLLKKFNSEPLEYRIKYIRGEDIVQDALEKENIEQGASLLLYVEQKFLEYDKSSEMQRNVELLTILKTELSHAVNVTVVTKGGIQKKVENNVRGYGGDDFKIGRYSNEVLFTDIDYIMYKKKIYGKRQAA